MDAKCPGCGNAIAIGEEHRGTVVACPWCSRHLRIPPAVAKPLAPPVARPVAPAAATRAWAPATGDAAARPSTTAPPPTRPSKPAPVPRSERMSHACPLCGTTYQGTSRRCSSCGKFYSTALMEAEGGRSGGSIEESVMNAGVVGGGVALAVALVWFYLGWRSGYIFFYPPILAIFGVVAIVKGLASPTPRRRTRRP